MGGDALSKYAHNRGFAALADADTPIPNRRVPGAKIAARLHLSVTPLQFRFSD
jgi:hypothetical protein